jgi:acyl dehydratase
MSAPPRLSTTMVGAEIGPLAQHVDARWLMAYAAALGERDPRYFETRGADGPMAHPLFPVCYEWPAALAIRAKTVPDDLAPLSVHATHHLSIARPPRAGDTLLTSARVIGLRRRRAGALVTTRFTTVDERAAAVTVTDYGSVYRGVEADGDLELEPPRPPRPHPGAAIEWSASVEVDAGLAHVYTECARIWNPIHTDVAVARAAGLSGIILHGTATLALAVSRVLARDLGGDARRVTAVHARFTGMVPLPSRFTVRRHAGADPTIAFDAVTGEGASVLAEGALRT